MRKKKRTRVKKINERLRVGIMREGFFFSVKMRNFRGMREFSQINGRGFHFFGKKKWTPILFFLQKKDKHRPLIYDNSSVPLKFLIFTHPEPPRSSAISSLTRIYYPLPGPPFIFLSSCVHHVLLLLGGRLR